MTALGIELQILDFIQNIRMPVLDQTMRFITKLGNFGSVWVLLAVILLLKPQKRKAGVILIAALCTDLLLCNGILKNLFDRVRPCDVNSSVQLLIARPIDSSFPSGHTAVCFAAAAARWVGGGKRLWKPAVALAALIAFSRMYLYVHYPTDILGGIIAGIAAGYIGFRIVSFLKRQRS